MADLDKAVATQLANITKRTGKSLDDFAAIMKRSGLTKHGELRDFLKTEHGLGHGDANTIVHMVLNPPAASAPSSGAGVDPAVVDAIYTGPKAGLRPVHDRLMQELAAFGDFEIAPKKGYLSFRRKKQFVMFGPATNSKVEIGFNMKGVKGTARLVEQKPGGMCQYKVRVTPASAAAARILADLNVSATVTADKSIVRLGAIHAEPAQQLASAQ